MDALRLYSIYHLNLLFSSVSEEQRPDVLARCYWPLLKLADAGAKIAIEATGYTLEEIDRMDPAWTAAFKAHLAAGRAEFIGSGYAQVIGPLVPAEVTARNLQIGMETYERLLGTRPNIGYVNEQTYAAGLLPLYAEAGYEAVVMEWNNAVQHQKDWKKEWRYQVVEAAEPAGTLPVVWNDSVAFQKFQRYAHGELQLEELQEYLAAHAGPGRAFSLYGNDAEIFDFRPGRYKTEAALGQHGEWERIAALYAALSSDARFESVFPSEVLDAARTEGSLPRASLVTPDQPIVVKKQQKYNLSRWALTGRDSLAINTECFCIYRTLMEQGSEADPALWKDLCYAWDSDFRTHITEERFAAYRAFLSTLSERAGVPPPAETLAIPEQATSRPISIEHDRFTIETPKVVIKFNTRRGLVLEALTFPEVSPEPLVGTVPHGFFDYVPFNADFYTGNTVIDVPAQRRVTDLERADDVRAFDLPDGRVLVTVKVSMHNGSVMKYVTIDGAAGEVTLEYVFELDQPTPARFQTMLMTFNPRAFERESLFYATTNGGRVPDRFSLADVSSIEPEVPVSMFVSTKTILGDTTGRLEVGDAQKRLVIEHDPADLAALPFLGFTELEHTYFLRTGFSLAEFDDTTALRAGALLPPTRFRVKLSAMR